MHTVEAILPVFSSLPNMEGHQASGPNAWAGDHESADSRIDTRGLEAGIAGMNLVSSSLRDSSPGRRKETGSTVSSTHTDDDIPNTSHHHMTDFTSRGSAPGSPGGEKHLAKSYQNRPPGLAGPLPSPIDGNSEWAGRHPSPLGETPALPYLNSGHRRMPTEGSDASGLGSFNLQDNDDDGLLGLEALRKRVGSGQASGGGNVSSSPPVARGYFPPQDDSRPKRDRPPLSQPTYADSSAGSFAGDRSVGDRSTGSYGLPSYPPTNVSMESGDVRGFGAIGAIARPELRQNASEYDPNRRRTMSADNFQSGAHIVQQQQAYDQAQQVSQKFGSLQTLGSHLQQQRVHVHMPPENIGEVPRPRHIRSVSQPMQGPMVSGVQHIDPRYYGTNQQEAGFGRSAGLHRVASASHAPLSGSFENASHYTQKRPSLPNYTGVPHGAQGNSQVYTSLQRRDVFDFNMQQGATSSAADDMRMYGSPMISPGQSPLQVHYHSHSRQPSDATSGILSSSPISMTGSGLHRVQPSAHGINGVDDDLSHPLMGENIEVPAEHFGVSQGGFAMHHQSMPVMHSMGGLSHSMSLDQSPAHYLEAQHHLPTAGAALPVPKVVYNVKFKRTQKNFVLGPRISRDLKIGTYVKVEADRGEDLGIVVGKVPADKYNYAARNQYTAGMGPPPGTLGAAGAADLKRIIRLATHDEVSLLGMKREEEEELLKICRAKVRQRGLPMFVVDAEYQFDRHKLTFFFEAEGRVDFRELVRDLFSMYKTRIWMQQLDKNTSTSSPAIIAPNTANLQMDYGTPIIAPPSEFSDSIVFNGLQGS